MLGFISKILNWGQGEKKPSCNWTRRDIADSLSEPRGFKEISEKLTSDLNRLYIGPMEEWRSIDMACRDTTRNKKYIDKLYIDLETFMSNNEKYFESLESAFQWQVALRNGNLNSYRATNHKLWLCFTHIKIFLKTYKDNPEWLDLEYKYEICEKIAGNIYKALWALINPVLFMQDDY